MIEESPDPLAMDSFEPDTPLATKAAKVSSSLTKRKWDVDEPWSGSLSLEQISPETRSNPTRAAQATGRAKTAKVLQLGPTNSEGSIDSLSGTPKGVKTTKKTPTSTQAAQALSTLGADVDTEHAHGRAPHHRNYSEAEVSRLLKVFIMTLIESKDDIIRAVVERSGTGQAALEECSAELVRKGFQLRTAGALEFR